MSADYPGKIVERLKTAVNNLSQSLSSDVGEDDDEILVVSTAGAPDSGSFHLENEIVFYPDKSSIKYGPGLTRGADGTTKSIHLKTDAGGEIKFGPEAHHINYPNEEIIAIQTVLGITGAFNFATLVGAETLTNKTLTKPVINGTDPTGAIYTPGTGAQNVALDCAANNMHIVTGHAQGTAITFTIANATNNQPFIVSILQDAVVSTIAAWFATVRWADGVTPTLTATVGKRDYFGFIRTGSNTYDGFIVGQNL